MKSLIFASLLLSAACGTDSLEDPIGPDAGLVNDDGAPIDSLTDAGPGVGAEPDAAPEARGCDFAEPACGSENICVENTCVFAWNRNYRIWVYDAEVPTHDPDGYDWDSSGGAPDLYVSVMVNGSWIGQTGTVMNEFSATYIDVSYTALVLAPDTPVSFYVADNDAIPGDPGGYLHAFTCGLSITANFVDPAEDGGMFTCSGAPGTLHAKIEPQ